MLSAVIGVLTGYLVYQGYKELALPDERIIHTYHTNGVDILMTERHKLRDPGSTVPSLEHARLPGRDTSGGFRNPPHHINGGAGLFHVKREAAHWDDHAREKLMPTFYRKISDFHSAKHIFGTPSSHIPRVLPSSLTNWYPDKMIEYKTPYDRGVEVV